MPDAPEGYPTHKGGSLMGSKVVASAATAGVLALAGVGSAAAQEPAPACSCVTTIDGYVFVGIPYAEAVAQWLELQSQPGYVSLPPVTSVSTTIEVSGTVSENDQGGNQGGNGGGNEGGDTGD